MANEERDQAQELQKAFDESQKAAIDAREDQPSSAETEEQYYERIANVPGVFGDMDTAIRQDVPSRNNEAATVAVAEADAQAEEGDNPDVSVDEARRQVNIAADATPSAQEVEKGADDNKDDAKEDDKSKSSRSTKK